MRILAIDYGDVRTGLAVSDALGILCGEAWTVEERDADALADYIVRAAAERQAGELVLGLPKNMDGTEGPRAEKSRILKEKLEARCALPVVLWDERRTTVDAHRILHANGKRMKKHRQHVDAVAASLILEAYLGTMH